VKEITFLFFRLNCAHELRKRIGLIALFQSFKVHPTVDESDDTSEMESNMNGPDTESHHNNSASPMQTHRKSNAFTDGCVNITNAHVCVDLVVEEGCKGIFDFHELDDEPQAQ